MTRAVARLSAAVASDEDARLVMEAFGIDYVINPDEEAAREIVGLMEGRQVTESVEFDEGRSRRVISARSRAPFHAFLIELTGWPL